MLTMKNLAKRGRLIVFGLVTGLVIGTATPASAQIPIRLVVDPDTLPDLAVSVNTPTAMRDIDETRAGITVNNLAPLKGMWRFGTGNNVTLSVDFTGFFVTDVRTDDGSLRCSIRHAYGQYYQDRDYWNSVDCSGFIAWGASSRISVTVAPISFFCDGRPIYTDAAASFGEPERTKANNRTIVRTSVSVYAAFCF